MIRLAETVEAMKALKAAGKIRHWGVSNLDTDDMNELVAADGKPAQPTRYFTISRGEGPNTTCGPG